MPDAIVQLTAADFENAMDFMNMVFSAEHPTDFPKILPKIYQPTDEAMQHNYAIKRNGKIRAVVGLFPIELHLGRVVLKVGGIGGVSTHPNDRGLGHMQQLMSRCLEVMKTEGYHLSWLAGQRQRYGFFGYEVCGCKLVFNVNKSNIKHGYAEIPPIRFEKITQPDDPRLGQIKQWHDASPIHVARPLEAFYDVSRSWRRELFAATNKNGDSIGYLVADVSAGLVAEMAAANDECARAIVPAWVNLQQKDTIHFDLPPVPSALVAELLRICEFSAVRAGQNWLVFDWPAVIEAALALKHQLTPLASGRFSLLIQDYGCVKLEINGATATCRRTGNSPDLACDGKSAMRLLFGPLPPALSGYAGPPVLPNWCPLPLYLPRQDEV